MKYKTKMLVSSPIKFNINAVFKAFWDYLILSILKKEKARKDAISFEEQDGGKIDTKLKQLILTILQCY